MRDSAQRKPVPSWIEEGNGGRVWRCLRQLESGLTLLFRGNCLRDKRPTFGSLLLAGYAGTSMLAASAGQGIAETPRGVFRVELDLDTRETVSFEIIHLNGRPKAFTDDPDQETFLCEPPYQFEFIGFTNLGHGVLASVEVDFSYPQFSRPTITLMGEHSISAVVVDFTPASTPEEIAIWQPETQPVRDGKDWVVDVRWDFEPARTDRRLLHEILENPDAEPELALPRWLDPETGEETLKSIIRASVHADLRNLATYEDLATKELLPCP